ncbi:coiled-coil domain-containing protein [Brachionus plicatilis]|uniref:Coiled-coil domain-containing protein n=1 Tax=Brachionus plicatilis TaxID=10195 RepID=A0A3M7P2F5_BRAPC|nr:coiled-coil domain-containing protein [Brachionus plicatilis]
MDIKDYFRTLFENKLLVKMPEKEEDHLTPATKLLEKRREMGEVETALAAEKEEFQMKMESLSQRRIELEKKEMQLKESVIKFDKFLKENDAKLSRAVKKAEDERELQKAKQKEIERLQSEIETLTTLKEKLQRKVQKNSKFNRYLEQSVEALDEFQEIREVIDRYETLTTNYKDLLEIEKENQERINDSRKELNSYLERKNYEILTMNNELAELQTRLDRCQNESHKAENEWNHIQTTAAGKTLLIGETRMAIRNLYQLVIAHHGKNSEKYADVDTDHQLKKAKFVNDLTKITNELSREGLAYYSTGSVN